MNTKEKQKPGIDNIKCPFCNPGSEREIILESSEIYSIYDKFPVSNGHALIIPKRHCADYFELDFREQSECFKILNEVKRILDIKFNPEGYNIGVNSGKTAGQTVMHVHIHLIPRYAGDVDHPEGGVRNVIPEKARYLKLI